MTDARPMTTRRRRRTRRPRATAAPPPQPPLLADEARALAGQMLRDLSPLAGDREAVRTAMLARLDAHGTANLGAICTAATFQVFAECLSRWPTPDPPPGALAYDLDDKGETQHD